MIERIFKSMSPEASKFYHKVFNRALLNMYAVKNGSFDTLFCETEDPRVLSRWKKALPGIVAKVQVKIDEKKRNGDL